MAWTDWEYEAGPAGGTLIDLMTYCEAVRVVSEVSVGKRGQNPVVEYKDGEAASPRKNLRAKNFMLEVFLRYTNNMGAVTHADGPAGHVMENFSAVAAILGGLQDTMVRLQRTSPHQGEVYIDCEVLGDALPSQSRHIFQYPMHAPFPYWIGAADTGNTGTTMTVAGSAPITNAVISVTGTTTDPLLTHTASGSYIGIEGVLPSGGVLINVGTEAVTRISGGADWSGFLVVKDPWWFILDPGANAVSISEASGTPTFSLDWFTQWR